MDTDPVAERQQSLTARLRCWYAGPARRAERPRCRGMGVVAYGDIVLCSECDKMRSALGRTQVGRSLPGAELAELIDAAAELSRAEQRLGRALRLARAPGASWSQVGDAIGVSRQAAQQRFGGFADNDQPSRATHDDEG